MADPERGAGLAVALTGGIACGKSLAAGFLAAAGVPVLDADAVAHGLMEPGGPAAAAVAEAFGPEMLDARGAVDRRRLGERVFADADARRRLNALVHPLVAERIAAWRAERRRRGEPGWVVVPLLFEAGLETGWDAVVCVVSRGDLVRRRLAGRGLGAEDAERRMAAQMEMAEKAGRSDFVVENNGTTGELRRKMLAVWRAIREKERVRHA